MGDYLRRAYDEAERVASRGGMTGCNLLDFGKPARQNGKRLPCERLIDENAKLRERVAKLEELLPENGRWFRAETVEAYVAEIAKLRKLVSNCHGWLAVNCEKGYVIPRNGLDAIEQSMHELGIEVDDARVRS